MVVALATDIFDPHRLPIGLPAIALEDRPRPRQRMVDHGDFVEQQVAVVLVEVEPLLDDGLVVVVERNSAGVVSARAGEAARLDLEHVVLAVAVGIDPFPDGIAEQGRLETLGPLASVGKDPPRVANVLDQDVHGVRRDDEFRLAVPVDHARHAGRHAGIGFADALSAGRLVGEIGLEAGLVFRRQRRLLGRPPGLRRVEDVAAPLAHAHGVRIRSATPQALQIGIFRFVERRCRDDRRQQHAHQHRHNDRATLKHRRFLPIR